MANCPIEIEECPAPSGPGKMWRIKPLGWASENNCKVRTFIGDKEITGTGSYGDYYVDGFAQNGMIQINPPQPPGTISVVSFHVTCPVCESVLTKTIKGPPAGFSWWQILLIVGTCILASALVIAGLIAIGILIGQAGR